MLECLTSAGTKTFRIEELPKEELDVANDELLIPVAHFQKVIKNIIIQHKHELNYFKIWFSIT
jgi:hypothetical protein